MAWARWGRDMEKNNTSEVELNIHSTHRDGFAGAVENMPTKSRTREENKISKKKHDGQPNTARKKEQRHTRARMRAIKFYRRIIDRFSRQAPSSPPGSAAGRARPRETRRRPPW